MRKKRFLNTVLMLVIGCFIFTSKAQNDSIQQETQKTTEQVVMENYNWDVVILAIAKLESGYNPRAVSKSGKYVGYLQISPELVQECNNILGKKHYALSDRYSVEKSKEMFVLIQKKYNKTCSVEKAIRIWNGGPNGWKKSATLGYYKRVMSNLYQISKL